MRIEYTERAGFARGRGTLHAGNAFIGEHERKNRAAKKVSERMFTSKEMSGNF